MNNHSNVEYHNKYHKNKRLKENILLKQVMFVQSMTTTGGPSTKWAFLWFWPHNTRRPSTPQQYQATPSLIFFFGLTARLNYAQAGRNKKRGKLTKLLIIWVNTNWGLDNVILKGRKCNKIIDLHNSHNIRCWKDNKRAFTKIHVWNFVHVWMHLMMTTGSSCYNFITFRTLWLH